MFKILSTDGGVFVSNPGMSACAEAAAMRRSPDEMLMVSLGTGVSTRKIPFDDAKDWGLLGWVRPVISIMMDGEADAADYQLRQFLPDVDAGDGQRYFRFDTRLDLALDDVDAAAAGNIANLQREAGGSSRSRPTSWRD